MNSLARLALKHGSDKYRQATEKWIDRDYCTAYETFFSKLKDEYVSILELGIGGYHHPDRGGSSLLMWHDYFTHPSRRVVGLDIYDKSGLDMPFGIWMYKGSQIDEALLNEIFEKFKPNIIIDDGSHINSHVIESFTILFPKMASGSIYVIEDYESSWWPEHGFGGTRDLNDIKHPSTFNFLRKLQMDINHRYVPMTEERQFAGIIHSMHIYENIVFIIRA